MLQKLSSFIFSFLAVGVPVFSIPQFVDVMEGGALTRIDTSFVEEQNTVQEKARKEEKYVLIAYLGQSWCPWSKKLIDEVLIRKEFLEGTREFAYLGFVDVPEGYGEEVGGKIEDIIKKYDVKELPFFVLLDKEGKIAAKFGYLPLQAEDFTLHIKKMTADYEEIVRGFGSLKELSVKELESLYIKAKSLGCERLREEIFAQGLKKEESAFFLVEKYAALLQTPQKSIKDRKALKKQILAKDPNNTQGFLLQIAQMDFASLSHNLTKRNDIKKVTAPLVEYIKEFGKKDSANVWHVELALAEYLFSKDAKEEALLHALASYESAPEERKNEIIDVVSYIRKGMEEVSTPEFAKK